MSTQDDELEAILEQMVEAKDWLRGAESATDTRAGEVLLKSAKKAYFELSSSHLNAKLQRVVDRVGGLKVAETNKRKYGDNFYQVAGRRGGQISKRGSK